MGRTFSRSFSGGELTPEFWGQIADAKYQTGLATCRNFEVLPHGPVQNRAGFAFVREVKTSDKRTRLLPFVYSTTQTMVLEFGEGYIRFHTQGATLLSLGVPYEVATPYTEADLFDVHYVQSADVLTLVHPNYPPKELRRLAATNWTLTDISFAATLAAPTGTAAAPSAVDVTTTYNYVVTAVGADTLEESLKSATATCTNNLLTTGRTNTITWAAVTGATRYNVYKDDNGLWGFIGQTAGLTFVDENITADVSKTPPEANNPFSGAGNYPGAVSYYEQRRVFAGTTLKPQNFWGTRTGTESNMSFSIPSRDDDAVTFRVAAREANTIRHVVPLRSLILLTSSAEWWVTSSGGAITPTDVKVEPQSYIGSNNVQPVIVNNSLIYAAARGGHVRELAYNEDASGFLTGDLCLRAPHLFDGYTVNDMTFVKAPQPKVWAVSSSGDLLGLTYVPEQGVGAWHRHDTGDGDVFESVTSVAEGDTDVVYAIVRRTINGSQVRYVERMQPRAFADLEDCFFVDCGLTYDGAPADTISGLSHLEGCTVSILADGCVHPKLEVVAGEITLEQEASKVHVGLPIEADLQTLPLVLEAQAFAQGREKNVNAVWLRVYRSSGIFAGPNFDKLTEAKQRTTEPAGTAPALKTDEIKIVLTPTWASAGGVCIRQSDPLPLTVVSMTLDVTVGG